MKCSQPRKEPKVSFVVANFFQFVSFSGQKWRKKLLFLIPPIGEKAKKTSKLSKWCNWRFKCLPETRTRQTSRFQTHQLTPLSLSRGKVSCDKTGLSLRPRTSPIKWISWCLKEIGIGPDLMRRSKSSNSEYYEKTKKLTPLNSLFKFFVLAVATAAQSSKHPDNGPSKEVQLNWWEFESWLRHTVVGIAHSRAICCAKHRFWWTIGGSRIDPLNGAWTGLFSRQNNT